MEALVFPIPQCFSPNVQCAYHGYMHTTHYTLHMHTIFPLLLLLLLLLLPRPHDGTFLRHSADIQKNVSRRMSQDECLQKNDTRLYHSADTVFISIYAALACLFGRGPCHGPKKRKIRGYVSLDIFTQADTRQFGGPNAANIVKHLC